MERVVPIGGYFELELPAGEEYHKTGMRFNLGRSCLEFLLRSEPPDTIYLPYYTCSAILESVKKLGLRRKFYSLNKDLEIELSEPISANSRILYTNYFGLKSRYIEQIASGYKGALIVDNAQAFYSVPVDGTDTFYSCRTFFGVPDGAYLYSDRVKLEDYYSLEVDTSIERMDYLLRRHEFGAREGYDSFRKVERSFYTVGIRRMSKLTERLVRSVRYAELADIRKRNYRRLHDTLGSINQLQLPLDNAEVPLAYPFLPERPGLRDHLIENNIFVPLYWDNVLENTAEDQWEYCLTSRLCALPIDQRLNTEDVNRIIDVVKTFLNGK